LLFEDWCAHALERLNGTEGFGFGGGGSLSGLQRAPGGSCWKKEVIEACAAHGWHAAV
jgi:hypothetical protein